MSSCNHLKLMSIFTGILSVVLYGAILFQPISIIEFQYAQMLLFSAQALLILTIIFIVCSVITSKEITDSIKMKKIVACSVGIVLVGCISLSIYGYLTCYNCYTPEDIVADEEYMQSFTPYHDISDEKEEHRDLVVSHMPGTDYVFLYCYGTYDYEIEYFSSKSPFLKWKFETERSVFTPFNEFYLDVLTPGKEMVVDGVKLTAFIDENNYAVLVKSFDQAVYGSLLNASTDKVSFENFAREIIKQMELLEEARDQKVFLDVPLSEMFV